MSSRFGPFYHEQPWKSIKLRFHNGAYFPKDEYAKKLLRRLGYGRPRGYFIYNVEQLKIDAESIRARIKIEERTCAKTRKQRHGDR